LDRIWNLGVPAAAGHAGPGASEESEVGAGLVPDGGPIAQLTRLMGRGRALEVIWSANDIPGDWVETLWPR